MDKYNALMNPGGKFQTASSLYANNKISPAFINCNIYVIIIL